MPKLYNLSVMQVVFGNFKEIRSNSKRYCDKASIKPTNHKGNIDVCFKKNAISGSWVPGKIYKKKIILS